MAKGAPPPEPKREEAPGMRDGVLDLSEEAKGLEEELAVAALKAEKLGTSGGPDGTLQLAGEEALQEGATKVRTRMQRGKPAQETPEQ
ncbi:hypothetical protein HN748_02450 [Candidatus Peregrinibacteria bacterium]|jgi:hypothetical protein|nr:hypothetical protein [Candidatus Peregrinibacteria bacterium]MBT7484014.1 hypothetical protein [Candidatus Peregrinibacteria bacterium]MBT7703069.1 hypothetical protein [Candidatus Peregrinibacteria bacterium]